MQGLLRYLVGKKLRSSESLIWESVVCISPLTYMQIADDDLARRKKGQMSDPDTGDVFVKSVYKPDLSKKSADEEDDKEENGEEDDGDEDDEDEDDDGDGAIDEVILCNR